MSQFVTPPPSNPPVLTPEEFDRITNPTFFVDRRVVWNLLHYIEANGFTPHSIDGERIEADTDDKEQVIRAAFNLITDLDYCWLSAGDKTSYRTYQLRLVLGNSGYDVISDWGIPDGNEDHPWNRLLESFDPRLYL